MIWSYPVLHIVYKEFSSSPQERPKSQKTPNSDDLVVQIISREKCSKLDI